MMSIVVRKPPVEFVDEVGKVYDGRVVLKSGRRVDSKFNFLGWNFWVGPFWVIVTVR